MSEKLIASGGSELPGATLKFNRAAQQPFGADGVGEGRASTSGGSQLAIDLGEAGVLTTTGGQETWRGHGDKADMT